MKLKAIKLVRILAVLLFGVYVFLLLYLTVLKRLYFGTTTGVFLENYRVSYSMFFTYSVNLIPFKTIYNYLVHPPNITVALTNILGNVLAFMPLGFLVPAIFKKLHSIRWILIVSICSSVVIELIQLLLRIGSTDIDDVILNSVGGLVGFFLYQGFVWFVSKYISDQTPQRKKQKRKLLLTLD